MNHNQITFDPHITTLYLKGSLNIIEIIDQQISKASKILESHNLSYSEASITFASTISLAVIMGNAIEIALKLKNQLEGQKIKKEHNLYILFNNLNESIKKDIQLIYQSLKKQNMPNNNTFDNIDELFKSNPIFHIDWRYAMEEGKGILNLNIQYLRLALGAILMVLPPC